VRVALFVHCFFPDHFYGTETYTLQLAQALQRLGHEVTVVAGIFQGEPRQPAPLTYYEYEGVPVLALDKNYEPHSRISETYWQDSMRPHLRRVLAELRPQLVHVTHLLNHTAVLLEEVKAAGIPLVGTLTDFFGFCYNNKLEAADGTLCGGPNALRSNCVACYLRAVDDNAHTGRRLRLGHGITGILLRMAHAVGWRRMGGKAKVVRDIVERPDVLKHAYGNYDAMIAPTAFLHDAYVANGFEAKRLHISHFGVNLNRDPKPDLPRSGPLIVGYIGQVARHKGVHLLVSAARSLPPGRVKLRIYGPADQDPAYMAQLRDIAPPDTEFLGTFPSAEMQSILAPMDLLAIPSTWYENSPLVLLNALASHTPVLVSDVQGLTEFVTEGLNGWSFKRGSSADLGRVLSQLADDPAQVRQASKHTHYDRTTQIMGDAVAAIYADVLGHHVIG
jgi:glycosyltransferase involved in cell wall biosynthesis